VIRAAALLCGLLLPAAAWALPSGFHYLAFTAAQIHAQTAAGPPTLIETYRLVQAVSFGAGDFAAVMVTLPGGAALSLGPEAGGLGFRDLTHYADQAALIAASPTGAWLFTADTGASAPLSVGAMAFPTAVPQLAAPGWAALQGLAPGVDPGLSWQAWTPVAAPGFAAFTRFILADAETGASLFDTDPVFPPRTDPGPQDWRRLLPLHRYLWVIQFGTFSLTASTYEQDLVFYEVTRGSFTTGAALPAPAPGAALLGLFWLAGWRWPRAVGSRGCSSSSA